MDIDIKGMLSQSHLVNNLRFPNTSTSSVITKGDFSKIGKLEEIFKPSDCGVKVIKI